MVKDSHLFFKKRVIIIVDNICIGLFYWLYSFFLKNLEFVDIAKIKAVNYACNILCDYKTHFSYKIFFISNYSQLKKSIIGIKNINAVDIILLFDKKNRKINLFLKFWNFFCWRFGLEKKTLIIVDDVNDIAMFSRKIQN